MEPQSIFDLSAQEFEGAIAELGLPQSEADQLRRQYRRQNSPFSGLYGLLDSVRGQDAEQGLVRADVLPMIRPEGMTGMEALLAGEAQLALPGGLLGAAEGAAMGIDAPGSAYQGMIPLEDMAGEALGTAGMAMLGGGAVARPAGSVAPSDFGQGWSDAYHWTRSGQPFSQFDPDRSTSAMSQLGPHVGTLEAAQARALGFPNETGQMIPLRADLRRPFLNPQTNQPWSEMDLEVFLSDMADEHGVSRQEIAPIMRGLLAREGYTDIPYVNDVEDAGSISNIMLVDRPAGSDAVLRRQDAAFDPARRADPNILAANRSTPTGAVGLLANEGRTPEFQQWFGNSAVVDETGAPLVVYHATDEDFDAFDFSRLGQRTRQNATSEAAAVMAELGAWVNTRDISDATASDIVLPLYSAIENPLSISFEDLWLLADDYESGAELRAYLRANGYDGLAVEDTEFGGTSYVAFEPSQIKSIFNPRPTADPRLMYQNASPELGLLAASAPSEQEQLDQLRTYLGLLAQ